jgi:hypothetical protein
MPCLNAEQASSDRNARNAGKVLHVQLFEISAPTDPEKLEILSTEKINTQAQPRSFISCDQSKASLSAYSRRLSHQAAASHWYFDRDGHEIDLHRDVDRIYVFMELDLKNGHFCRTSVTIPLVDVPTFTDLEAQLKGARLDARWVGMQTGFKLAIGLAYTERKTGPPLDVRKDFDNHGMLSENVLKLTKKDTRQAYAARKLVGSLRRPPPFPATAEGDLRVAAFVCEAYWYGSLMMISPRAECGHLFYYLQQERTFSLERSRIYIAELFLIFESMCSHGFIQQDLRPLAVKLNYRGHVMYCDFDLYQSGSSMKPDIPLSWQENRYLAPEALTQLESNSSTGKISIPAWMLNLFDTTDSDKRSRLVAGSRIIRNAIRNSSLLRRRFICIQSESVLQERNLSPSAAVSSACGHRLLDLPLTERTLHTSREHQPV